MNCPFCPCEMVDVYRDDSSVFKNWKCTICKTMRIISQDATKICYYYFDYQDYRAVFFPNVQQFELVHMEPVEHDIKGIIFHRVNVLTLDYLPNITPQNIAKKLSTLLTFL
jgi:hypothetical protein